MISPLRLASVLLLTTLGLGVAQVGHTAPVGLKTEDGVQLTGEAFGTGETAVLFIHGEKGSTKDFKAFSEKLASKGYRVLAINLRGHGTSKGSPDFSKMVSDVHAATKYLTSKGVKTIHAVGAEAGAVVLLNAASNDQRIDTVALLSPALSAQGLKVSGPIGRLGERPVLVVSGNAPADARAAKALHQSAKGPKHLEVYDATGGGAQLLNTAADLEGLLFGWVSGNFFESVDPGSARDALLKTDAEDVETTGEGFSERGKK